MPALTSPGLSEEEFTVLVTTPTIVTAATTPPTTMLTIEPITFAVNKTLSSLEAPGRHPTGQRSRWGPCGHDDASPVPTGRRRRRARPPAPGRTPPRQRPSRPGERPGCRAGRRFP